jgi:hypothetical protein
MQVSIKKLNVTMNLGSEGLTLDVYDTDGKFRGDLRVGKAKIEWCKGKTHKGNGVEVSWDELIDWFEQQEK